MDEGFRKAFNRAGDWLALQQRFAAGPAHVPNPPGVGLKVAREAEDLLHHRVDAAPREVSPLPPRQPSRTNAAAGCRGTTAQSSPGAHRGTPPPGPTHTIG